MIDSLLDAVIDSLKIFPFIFVIYVFMELIESAHNKEKIERSLASPFAPLVASGMGIIPECGFAVMCAKLYDKGLIKIGTLVAAFIAVSDEGIIILLSGGAKALNIVMLVAIKVVYAILVGTIVNLFFAKNGIKHTCPEKDDCIECGKVHHKPVEKFFLHPLLHATTTFIYILVLNIIFNFAIFLIGSQNVETFIDSNYYLQPIVSSLVGLIPNCASSIILAQAYLKGVLSFAGLVAGLSANAGVGILILFKSKKNIKSALLILLLMFVAGLIIGYSLIPFKI